MLKIKVGKRADIKFKRRIPHGEIGELLEAIVALKVGDALFVTPPKEAKEAEVMLSRLRVRIQNWRSTDRIPVEIGVSITEDNYYAIYHRVMKKKTAGALA